MSEWVVQITFDGDVVRTVVALVAVVVASRNTFRADSRHVSCLLTVRTTCAANKAGLWNISSLALHRSIFIDSTKIPKYPKRIQDDTLSS